MYNYFKKPIYNQERDKKTKQNVKYIKKNLICPCKVTLGKRGRG